MPDAGDAARTNPTGDAAARRGHFFIGSFDLHVDDKGRLLIPADFRKAVDPDRDGSGFIVITGKNGQVWLYPDLFYQDVIAPKSNDPVPEDDELDYLLATFGQARRLQPDKAGRIVLPESDVDRERLGKEVALVGAGNHMQLWPRAEWRAWIEEKRKNMSQVAGRYRQANDRRQREAVATARA